MSNKLLVFVYGTLKQGHHNHRLLEDSTYMGKHTIKDGYLMYNLGAYPAVIKQNGEGLPVHGEIYEITEATLKSLDVLEGYPELYYRETIHTEFGDAIIYLMKEERLWADVVVVDGEW